MSLDINDYIDCRDAMPTCTSCGAANSGNITCPVCRETNRVEYKKHDWPTDFLDRLDEINPVIGKPVGVGEVRRFMERFI